MKVRTVSLGTGPENSRKFCTFVSMSVILRCSFMEYFLMGKHGTVLYLTVPVDVLQARAIERLLQMLRMIQYW